MNLIWHRINKPLHQCIALSKYRKKKKISVQVSITLKINFFIEKDLFGEKRSGS